MPRAPGAASILVIVMLAAAYFVPRGPMWNADSRLFLTASIVDRGQLNIDPFGVDTGDVAWHSGHYYSDKAPGMSLLAVPVYVIVKYTLLRGHTYASLFAAPPDQRLDFIPRYFMALVFAGLPTAVLAALLYQFFGQLGIGRRWRTLLSLTYGLGTIAFPFASVFFGHQLAAALLFGAFMLLHHMRGRQTSTRIVLLAGLLAGSAVITEYPTAIIAAALGVYAFWPCVPQWREVVRFALGALPALALAATYNTLAFGSPLSQGYAHLAGPSTFQIGQAQGLMGITYPHLDALWQTTLGPYRGLFFLSPVLLLSIPALVLMVRNVAWRREGLLCAGIVVLYGLFTISYYAWDGGYSLGPRHFLPALPYLVVPLGFLARPERAKFWRIVLASLAALSIAVVTVATATGPLMNPGFYSPLTQFVLPSLLGLHTDAAHPAATSHQLGAALLHSLPLFPYAVFDNNWGLLFGLPGMLQLLPLGISIMLVLIWRAWTAHSARVERAASGSRM